MRKPTRKSVWEVFKDDSSKEFEILGRTTDDSQLTNNSAEMQEYGIGVRCETPVGSLSEEEIRSGLERCGYKYKDGLYTERLKDLEIAKIARKE